jgi:hypothetical protein
MMREDIMFRSPGVCSMKLSRGCWDALSRYKPPHSSPLFSAYRGESIIIDGAEDDEAVELEDLGGAEWDLRRGAPDDDDEIDLKDVEKDAISGCCWCWYDAVDEVCKCDSCAGELLSVIGCFAANMIT